MGEVLERIHQGSSNARLELIQFKVMHILHYFIDKNNKLFNKLYPNVTCDRYNIVKGNPSLTFWSFS